MRSAPFVVLPAFEASSGMGALQDTAHAGEAAQSVSAQSMSPSKSSSAPLSQISAGAQYWSTLQTLPASTQSAFVSQNPMHAPPPPLSGTHESVSGGPQSSRSTSQLGRQNPTVSLNPTQVLP